MLVQQALEVLHSKENADDWCLLQVDLSNAFNSVTRQKVIYQLPRKPLISFMGANSVR